MIKECNSCDQSFELNRDAVFIDVKSGNAHCPKCNTLLVGETKMYYKVYQDKTCVQDDYRYYVIEPRDIADIVNASEECGNELHPVFEPVFMAEETFNALPEFEGY
jgi:hypothetical protein